MISLGADTGAASPRPIARITKYGGNASTPLVSPDAETSVRTTSAEAVVRPDGRISLPLLGDVAAAGSTPSELADRIRILARELLEAPQVTVQVKQVNSLKATIAGEVVRPGRYAVTSQTTVVELIAMAGGFTEFARTSRIGIVRSVNGTQTALKVDYRRISSLKDLRENVTLRPGDIVCRALTRAAPCW